MENDEERNERLQLYAKRSKGIFHIDSAGISTSNQELEFDTCFCNLIHHGPMLLKVENNDYSVGYSSSFDVDVEKKRVSDDFVKLLDKKSLKKTLKIIDTDCKVDYGPETLKICIISSNRIGLSRYYDLIILERKNKKYSK